MKRSRLLPPALGLLLAAACFAPALATEGPPIKVQIVPPPEGVYPLSGVPFQATLKISSGGPGLVSDLDLTGLTRLPSGVPTWNNDGFDVVPGARLTVDEATPLEVDFTATPADPTDPIVFSFQWNGQTFTKQISMSDPPTDFAKGTLGRGVDQTREVADFEPAFPGAQDLIRPEPLVEKQEQQNVSEKEAAEDAPRDGVQKKGYSIRVRGRFGYHDADGIFRGCDGATVRVKDSDWEWDDTLHSFTTDAFGNFDETFWYSQGEDPDVYLEFELANSRVEVERTNIWENNYKFRTGTYDDYTGQSLNFGTRTPSLSYYDGAVDILTSATRTWRWIHNVAGYDTPSLDIQWPESGDTSWHVGYWNELHITWADNFSEQTVAHEYGHHWVDTFADMDGSNYCNPGGYADSPGDCGHTQWCPETDQDAFREGYPYMISDFVTAAWESTYGYPPNEDYFVESIGTCGGTVMDAYKTEGHFTALLRDIIDSSNDDDDAYDLGIDDLDMTAQQIFQLVDQWHPLTPAQFIFALRSQYPNLKNGIWATCANNGYLFDDDTPPGQVTNLTSPTHTVGGDSPDATVVVTWTSAVDDFSGIDGYSVKVSEGSPSSPNTVQDVGDVTAWFSAPLSPGTYYITVRAKDRAGNWSFGYSSFGPFTIREPYPADFAVENQNAGWSRPVMPSNPDVCGFSTCGDPVILVGASPSTYLNVAFRNNGELPSTGQWSGHVLVDGTPVGGVLNFTTPVPVGATWTATGLGPFSIRGGRHTLGAFIDYPEVHAEQDETDNLYASQWVWTPLTLQSNIVVSRPAPPASTAGFTSVPFLYSPNCDGFRGSKVNDAFYAFVAWADDDDADYDLWLYPQDNGPTTGFDLNGVVNTGGLSGRPEGCLDMVMFRYDVAGANIFDAGVVNFDGDTSGFRVVKEEGVTIPFGPPVTATLPADRHLILRQFYVPTSQSFTVTASMDTAAGPVQMALYDSSFGTGDLLDYADWTQGDQNGEATLTGTGQGWHVVALFQDPKDVPGAAAAVAIDLRAFGTPADLLATAPFGWYAPLVPRPAADASVNNVPQPAVLNGNVDQTYVNHAWKNQGPVATPSFQSRVFVDGVSRILSPLSALGAGQTAMNLMQFPITVRGGRHTLSVDYDVNQEATESNEENNRYGLQFVWSPEDLQVGEALERPMPDDPYGGWDHALGTGPVLVYPNSDGLRTSPPTISGDDGRWQATAVMPGPSSDVDLRLHEIKSGTTGGFAEVRALSGWTEGQSDFVLANFRATSPPRGFDVGVTAVSGNEDYVVDTVESTFLDTNPVGTYPGNVIRTGHFLALHEVYLPAGSLGVVLEEESGDVDWGLSLYTGGLPYHNKSTTLDKGIAWMGGSGELESIYVDVPVAGYYCVAVWKADPSDVPDDAFYRLSFDPGATSVPDPSVLPTVAGIRSIHPNPFNPRTTIAYEVARAGMARLAIYNLRGELIRVLVEGDEVPGRHEVVWDGVDSAGRTVASGTYFARLQTASNSAQRKLLLLK